MEVDHLFEAEKSSQLLHTVSLYVEDGRSRDASCILRPVPPPKVCVGTGDVVLYAQEPPSIYCYNPSAHIIMM